MIRLAHSLAPKDHDRLRAILTAARDAFAQSTALVHTGRGYAAGSDAARILCTAEVQTDPKHGVGVHKVHLSGMMTALSIQLRAPTSDFIIARVDRQYPLTDHHIARPHFGGCPAIAEHLDQWLVELNQPNAIAAMEEATERAVAIATALLANCFGTWSQYRLKAPFDAPDKRGRSSGALEHPDPSQSIEFDPKLGVSIGLSRPASQVLQALFRDFVYLARDETSVPKSMPRFHYGRCPDMPLPMPNLVQILRDCASLADDWAIIKPPHP